MKVFSFLSILKNFGKQLSSLASQMPWCNLRFNLGSMSVLSRVSGPFSRTSFGTSRRVSHFAAMIFAVLTLSIANIGMAWGASPYSVNFTTEFTSTGTKSVNDGTVTIRAKVSSKTYNNTSSTYVAFLDGTFLTVSATSACITSISLNANTDNNSDNHQIAYATSADGSTWSSNTNIGTCANRKSTPSEYTVNFAEAVRYVRFTKVDNSISVGYISVTYSSCNPISPSLSYTSTSLMVGDNSSAPTLNKDGSAGGVTWTSSDEDVASVNSSGVVTAVGAGSATITATIAANGGKCEGTATANFTVTRDPVGEDHVITYIAQTGTGVSATLGTESKTSTSSYLTSLSDLTLNGLTISDAGKENSTPKIQTPGSEDASKYLYLTFNVASGYQFTITQISTKLVAVTDAKTVKCEISDNNGGTTQSLSYSHSKDSDPGTVHNFAFMSNNTYSGTVTVKLYVYGATSTYRLGKPLTITGDVEEKAAQSCTAPSSVSVSGTWDRFGGETISLTAIPEGGTGDYSYQWQKKIGDNWNNIEDNATATTNNLIYENCTGGNSGTYRCVVSTGADCSTASDGLQVKVYTLECYTNGTTIHHFTRNGNTQSGTLTLTLAANTTYEFKINADNLYYGNSGTIYQNVTNWVCATTQASNLKVFSGYGGAFTFTIDYSTSGNSNVLGEPEVSVTYPENKTIYVIPNGYTSDNAKLAIYYWNDGVSGWSSFLTKDACSGNAYYAEIPSWTGKISIVRLNSDATVGDWEKKWNQTVDITIDPTKDQYTVNTWCGNGCNETVNEGTYTPATYSITFNGNGGTGSMTTVEGIACGGSTTLAENDFARTGYTFAGWATSANGEKVYNDQATISNITSDITLYAKWTVNSYTVTWNPAGGNWAGNTNNIVQTYEYGAKINAPEKPSRTGYEFVEWNPTYVANETTMPAENTTYTAQWEEIEVESITVEPTTLDLKKGEYATLTATVLPADALNKTVTWDNTTITTLSSTTGNSITVTGTKNGSEKDLKAEADGKQATVKVSVYYEVQYNSNGGSECEADKYYEGNGVTLPTPTKSGYTFAGWYENEALTQSAGAAGDTYKPTDNITLYAKWNAATTDPTTTWTVAEEPVYAGQLVSVSVNTTSDATLDANNLTTNTGTLVNATVNGKTITAILQVPGDASDDITLTLTTSVTANYNASTSTKTITLSECPTTGGGGEEVIYSMYLTGQTACSVTGGTASLSKVSSETLTVNEKSYYKFDSSTKITISPTNGIKSGDKLIVDIASNNDDPVGFVLKNSDNTLATCTTTIARESATTITYTFEKDVPIVDITRTGSNLRFYGATITRASGSGSGESTLPTNLDWTTDPSAEVEKQVGDANFTYTASSSNSAGAITYSSSEASVATINSSTGEVTIVGAGTTTITATIAEIGCYPTKSIDYTLTVVSPSTTYTVTYDANGGTCSKTSETAASVTLPTPTWDGYTFQGWYNQGELKGTAGSSFNPAANITLYAKWTDNSEGKLFSYIDNNYGDKYKDFLGTNWVTASASGKDKEFTNAAGVTFGITDGDVDSKNNIISTFAKFKKGTTLMSIVIPDGKKATVTIKYGAYGTSNILTVGGANQTGPSAELTDDGTNAEIANALQTVILQEQTGTLTLGSANNNIYIAYVSAVVTTPDPEPTTYNVTTTLTNVTANSAFPATITADGSIERTITASDGYTLPSDITVTGATYTWNASTGVLTITNVTDNVTITIVGVENTPEPGDLYTVTFDTNGGSEVSPITQASVGVEINLPTPTKDGYEFVGWYIGGELVTANKYTPTADITATAAWKENCNIIVGGEEATIYATYFIEDLDGATVEGEKIDFKTTAADWATGYDKYLVTTGSAGYYQLTFDSPLDLNGYANKKIKVYWGSTSNRPLKVSINGGDLSTIDEITSSLERSLVREIEIDISISSLSSIKFISDGGKGVYLFKVEIIGTSGGGGGTCYYVTYNGNGADGGYVNDANAYAANEEVTTLANRFTRAGYTSTGWNTAADGSGTPYAAGGTFNITGNTELFAQWIENTNVDLSGCTGTTITYNLLTPNNPKPSQTVSPAGVITELTGATAQGTATTTTNTGSINNSFADYSVLYGASEGSDNAENGVKFTFTVPTGYVFKPSAINTNLMCYGTGKNGGTQNYVFYGTLSDGATTINGTALPGTANGANEDIEYSDIADKTLSGTVTLRLNAVKVGGSYQSFRIKSPITIVGELCSTQTYTITYDNNGGSGDMESTSNVVAENEFTRDGYTFDGWNTAANGTGKSYAAGEIVASNTLLYAQWKCIEPKFTVSYSKTEYTKGETASALIVSVTAGNVTGYQWYSSTTNDRNNGNKIGGATSDSYTPSTTSVGTTYYWCEIENTCTSVQTAMIAITVREDKSNPTVTWTDPSDVNYGGGNYSISATVNGEWDGTLTADMLTAPTGINLYNVLVQGNTISATFDVTTTFDRTAGNTIPFVLTLPETTTYNPLVSENMVSYDACATRGGSEYVIPVNGSATKDGNYYYWINENGWISPSPNNSCSGVAQATTFADGETFDYVHGSNSQTTFVRTFKAGIDKVRIYANFRASGMTVTDVYKHSDYFSINDKYKLSISSDYTIMYNGDVNATNLGESEYGFVDIVLNSPLAQNEIIALKFNTSRVRVQGAAIIEQSAGTIETTLSFATAGSITKTQNDANFTNKATPSNNTLGTITYSSSNTSVATVNPTTGEVSIIAAGTTTITATLDLSGCYKGAMATYELTVNEQICAIAAGTLSASKTDKYDCEEVTLTLSNYEPDATIEWWHNGEAITSKSGITINGNILTTTLEGTYSALVTKDCNVRSNSVTITNIASASATPLVSEWYVKNGRLTPPIALWKLEGGARIAGVGWTKGEEASTAPYDDPENVINVENGIVYLTGTPPQANNTEEDIRYTIQLSIMNSCDDSPMVVPSTITIIHQKNTDKHVLAFVVTGKEKGGFVEEIPAAQTTSVPLYNTISRNFEVLATNIYATDNEQLLKEYYSQFDIICITDYPDSKTTGVNGKSYTDAMGSLIDIRPILTMEAWVSKYSNWKNKGVTGDPKSPTTRQYSMLLQCKDHEIFAGTSLVSEDVDGETMYRVTMVDATKEDYVNLDKNTAGTDSYDHDGKPALQGFTYTSAMSSMLPIGIIDDGAGKGNNLQVGLERQHEIEARMMVIGVNSYAMERLTGDGEKVIINALNYLMKKNAEDISDCSIYFDNNGGTGDGLWSSPVNWGPSRNSLPQSSQEARILAPCVVSDYTAKVASVKIVTGGTYKYQSMNGEASGSLTIAPNGALVVKGRIQAATAPNYLEARNTDVKDLKVQSDATGNGALIHGEIGEAIGATVELLSKAYSVREYNDLTGKYKKKKYWQYVALPVQNALAEDAFWGAYTYQYDETQGWIKKGTGENIEEFWGIGLSIDNEVYSGANNEASLTKFTIKGNLALATDRDIDLTRTADVGDGQNMIGNSWTAPIHLTSMTADDFENAVATVYIYNTGRDEQASGSIGTASSADGSTQAGQWISIPIAPTRLDPWQGPKVIPSMQAFEVDLVEGKTSGVLHLNYDKHVRTIATPEEENLPLKAPKYLGNEPSMIRLRVADSITYTDLYLIEGDQFTDEFDNAWDGKYQPCDGRSATLYAMSPIGDMAVLAQPSVNNTSVVFEPGKKSEYVFTFGYNGDVTYYLNDMQLKISTEIKEGNEYRFTYNKGDMKNRFLVTRESFDSPNISTGLANIVTDGNGLQVTNPNQENLQVILIDAAGRMCSIYNTTEPMFKVELPATQGVYMINVKGETTNIVRKVVK